MADDFEGCHIALDKSICDKTSQHLYKVLTYFGTVNVINTPHWIIHRKYEPCFSSIFSIGGGSFDDEDEHGVEYSTYNGTLTVVSFPEYEDEISLNRLGKKYWFNLVSETTKKLKEENKELCNCLEFNHEQRIPRKNWKCPECNTEPCEYDSLDGGSAVCKNKKCRLKFHWCSIKGEYEKENSPMHKISEKTENLKEGHKEEFSAKKDVIYKIVLNLPETTEIGKKTKLETK